MTSQDVGSHRTHRLFVAVPAVLLMALVAACSWGDDCDRGYSSSSCEYGYGSSGYGSSGSSGYGSSGSSGYGSGRDDASVPKTDAACTEGFTVTFAAPSNAGNCKMLLSRAKNASEVAAYWFPAGESGPTTRCEAIEGPNVSRCSRVHDLVTLEVTDAAITAAIRKKLGVPSPASALIASLLCANGPHLEDKVVFIACVDPTTDAGSRTEDAACDH